MIAMELKAGEGVCIGTHTIQVLEIRAGEVVIALIEAEPGPTGRSCPICKATGGLVEGGSEVWYCRRCGYSWDD
jgi:transposase